MLTGRLENCYGIKEFDMGTGINFTNSNKALLYAPNGVMKTSLAKVFEDLSYGKPPKDRIFSSSITSYSIQYNGNVYTYSSAIPNVVPNCNSIYVINSFTEQFEFTKETVNTLLADEGIRNEYNTLINQFSEQIKQIEAELSLKSGLTRSKIKNTLIEDLELDATADWTDIINSIHTIIQPRETYDYLDGIKIAVLFSEKAIKEYSKPEFRAYIVQYIDRLNDLLQNSDLLSNSFTDRSAETLTKTLSSNNLFLAHHKIVLRDGTEILTLDDWRNAVNNQIQRMYEDATLHEAFEKLKKNLTANNDVDAVRQIIIDHREIIPLLFDISRTKKLMWATYCKQMQPPFEEYYNAITRFTEQIRHLYEQAAEQSERWRQVVEEFNRRFRVPFTVKINNKSNFILKDEAPNLSFVYKRGNGQTEESTNLSKDDLLPSLSMGEKRAMYLLYILFDLERIRIQAHAGHEFLIVIDDISDSFDYKNKYAIIEYLSDLSQNTHINLLMLTHNFDFYRTVFSRMSVHRDNCLVAQKDDTGTITMRKFPYLKNFFYNVIVQGINGTDPAIRKKKLIASIPFYRNLAEYCKNDPDNLKLTCYVHYKTTPEDTSTVTLSDLWAIINPYINGTTTTFGAENYYDTLQSLALAISHEQDEISLDNKLILSIAARLRAEKYMKRIIIDNLGECHDSNNNQTRIWYEQAKPFLSNEAKRLIDDIILITPESIHLNAFMFEPLIDVSIWVLNDIYARIVALETIP